MLKRSNFARSIPDPLPGGLARTPSSNSHRYFGEERHGPAAIKLQWVGAAVLPMRDKRPRRLRHRLRGARRAGRAGARLLIPSITAIVYAPSTQSGPARLCTEHAMATP